MQQGRYSDFRFERKFVSGSMDKRELEHLLRMHPAFFSEIYWERQINNIYFDTPALTYYFDNVAGKSERRKVRIRWYGNGNGQVLKPVLEFKIKSGQLGRKASFDLVPFNINDHLGFDYFQRLFEKSELPQDIIEELKGLRPSLLNNYCRKYYRSADKRFRFTIDFNLRYFAYSPSVFSIGLGKRELKNTILELKYDEEHDSEAMNITQSIPFRLNKSSKYVNGIDVFRNNLAV